VATSTSTKKTKFPNTPGVSCFALFLFGSGLSLFLIWFEDSPYALLLLVLVPPLLPQCVEFRCANSPVVRSFVHVFGDWITVSGYVVLNFIKGQAASAACLASVFFFIYFLSYPQNNAVERATNYRFASPQSCPNPRLVQLTWRCLHPFLSSYDNALLARGIG